MLSELQSNLMAPDEFKNLGFADEKQSDRQAKPEESTVQTEQEKTRK